MCITDCLHPYGTLKNEVFDWARKALSNGTGNPHFSQLGYVGESVMSIMPEMLADRLLESLKPLRNSCLWEILQAYQSGTLYALLKTQGRLVFLQSLICVYLLLLLISHALGLLEDKSTFWLVMIVLGVSCLSAYLSVKFRRTESLTTQLIRDLRVVFGTDWERVLMSESQESATTLFLDKLKILLREHGEISEALIERKTKHRQSWLDFIEIGYRLNLISPGEAKESFVRKVLGELEAESNPPNP